MELLVLGIGLAGRLDMILLEVFILILTLE